MDTPGPLPPARLNEIPDVATTAPSDGWALVYVASTSKWTPRAAPWALDAAAVHTAGNETIAGTKTFTAPIVGDITGNAATATSATSLTGTIAEGQVTGLVGDLLAKAPLASPTFTGTPAAPTAAAGTNTTQLATTAFVKANGMTVGNPVAGGTAGSIPFVGTGALLAQANSKLFWDATNFRLGVGTATPQQALDVGTGKITGGTNSATKRVTLDLSVATSDGIVDFAFPNLGIFRAAETNVLGTKDIFFQAVPGTTAGYGYLETWEGAGLVIGTGNAAGTTQAPVIWRLNRIERARLTPTGLGLGVVSPAWKLAINGAAGFQIPDSTTADVTAARIVPSWADSTHATRRGRLDATVWDASNVDRVGWTVSTDGTQATIGFLGAPPVAKAASPGTATGTDAAVVNAIATILRNLGFCS
jgi:hypothetical protein